MFEPTRVSRCYQRRSRLTLQARAHSRLGSESKCVFKMLAGGNQVAMQQVRFPDRLFLGQLFLYQSQRLGTIARATVSCNRFVKSKNTLGFGRGLLRIVEAPLVISSLNVMVGQLLHGAMGGRAARTFQTFSGLSMQAAAANRIQILVEHFADLVVSKSKRVAAICCDQLCADGFIQRVKHRVFTLLSGC